MRGMQLETTLWTLALGAFLAAPVAAQNPYEQPNNSWISLSGTVGAVTADQFTLDYGDGFITVEMDDGDRDADAYKLMSGDTVTVTGVIDDGLFETRTIEASSVYVANLDTYFFASAKDEEGTDNAFLTISRPLAVPSTIVQGTVTDVGDGEFKLFLGSGELTVEVEDMAYDPLDDDGYQKIEVGDVVRVTGTLDYDFLEGRELKAKSVTTLHSH